MKKLSFLCFALSTQMAYAAPHFNGFYASAGAGSIWMNSEIKHGLVVGEPSNFMVETPSTIHIESGGAIGFVGAGYTHQFQNHMTLGTEVTAGFSNVAVTHRSESMLGSIGVTLSGKVEVKEHNDFALLFKPGYVIKGHTHFYGLVGPRWGNLDTNLSTIFINELGTTYAKDTESGYQLGITAGVGLEHMLTQNLSLGLEYAYTSYGSIPSLYTSNSAVLIADTTINDNADIEVSTNTFMAQLSYHF